MMSYRHLLLTLALAIPAVGADAQAAGFSCGFSQYCVAGAQCVRLKKPMMMDLDRENTRYSVSIDEAARSKHRLGVAGERLDGEPLFLVGTFGWGYGFESWLLSIRPDGAAWLTVHRTKPFGEFETRRGTCEEKK